MSRSFFTNPRTDQRAPRATSHGEHEATIEIESERVHGHLPRLALALALEWTRLHRAELLEDWRRARNGEPLVRISPLE